MVLIVILHKISEKCSVYSLQSQLKRKKKAQ